METTQEIYNIHYNHYLEFNNTLRNQQSVLKLSQIGHLMAVMRKTAATVQLMYVSKDVCLHSMRRAPVLA